MVGRKESMQMIYLVSSMRKAVKLPYLRKMAFYMHKWQYAISRNHHIILSMNWSTPRTRTKQNMMLRNYSK